MANKQCLEAIDLVSFSGCSPDSGLGLECSYAFADHQKTFIRGDQILASSHDDGEQLSDSCPPETSSESGSFKYDDPLSEPIVKLSLEKVHVSGIQLMNMSVKELNKRLAHCPAFIISKLKKCRRTLKNRGYAKNCRVKRIALKNHLEQVNSSLIRENTELKQYNKSLVHQLNQLISSTNQATTYGLTTTNAHSSYVTSQVGPLNQATSNYCVVETDCGSAPGASTSQEVASTSLVSSTSANTTYYPSPLDSELDYFAEQLALD